VVEMVIDERDRRAPFGMAGLRGVLGVVARRAGGVVLGVCAVVGLAGAVAPGVALALPEGRVYEMVSPPYKGGYGATYIDAVAPDGESVAYSSSGVFAGAPAGFPAQTVPEFSYLARRGASGWSSASLLPPDGLMSNIEGHQDLSSTLESTLAFGKLGPNSDIGGEEGTQAEFLLHSTSSLGTEGGWEDGGILETPKKKLTYPEYVGGSADLCRLLVGPGSLGGPGSLARSKEETLLPAPAGTVLTQLYEFDRGCGGEPVSLRFVEVNNAGKLINPSCEGDLGVTNFASQDGVKEDGFGAVGADGGEVFFTANAEKGNCGSSHQLFVRLGGSRTLEVSRPLGSACVEVPCGGGGVAAARASADFAGASRDGSRVFFTTTASLVGEDRDEGRDLYMAVIGCPSGEGEACEPGETASMGVTSLVQVSHDSHAGEAAEVQGVVRVAPDGSRVYFVARGLLGEGANAEGLAPVKGADNLYVYERDARYPEGHTAFIADLCSGPGSSGVVEDLRCPADLSPSELLSERNDLGLWLETGSGEAQTAGMDGGFLVFSSYGQLTANDTDTARDVYRYDAESGVLERVSVGEGGFDANGNNDAFDAGIPGGLLYRSVREQYELNDRAVSEDGSRIVFTTSGPLSEDASNGLENAYEWHEGKVSLISTGSSIEPVDDVVISPSGRDVFFVTSQGLVPQDTDGAPDVYDARLEVPGEGFPAAAAPVKPCEGDACQGPLTNPAPLLVPASVVQAPGGNFPTAPAATVQPKMKSKTVKGAVKCKKGFVKKHGKCVKKAKQSTKTGRK
jgi:hypothetical protein